MRDRGPRAGAKFDERAGQIDGQQYDSLKILHDFTSTGDGVWTGYIYDRENGKTYRCRMRELDSDRLEVHPYIGIPLFGQTQIWHRAPGWAETSATTK